MEDVKSFFHFFAEHPLTRGMNLNFDGLSGRDAGGDLHPTRTVNLGAGRATMELSERDCRLSASRPPLVVTRGERAHSRPRNRGDVTCSPSAQTDRRCGATELGISDSL